MSPSGNNALLAAAALLPFLLAHPAVQCTVAGLVCIHNSAYRLTLCLHSRFTPRVIHLQM